MSLYHDIYQQLRAHQDRIPPVSSDNPDDGIGPEVRLMKLSEEVGEVMQAYIGFVGANKRKGMYATADDVANELTDVIITAMVALYDWTLGPEELLKLKVRALSMRVKEQGS